MYDHRAVRRVHARSRHRRERSGGACLTVAASGVTIDGNGNSIDNTGGGATTGVLVQGGNAVVRDLTATGWQDGVRVVDAEGTTIEGATLSGNQYGVNVQRTGSASISGGTLTGNDVGVVAEDSQVTLTDVDVTDNAIGLDGLYVAYTVQRSTVSNNDDHGIRVSSGSLTVERSAVENNGNTGIRVASPDSATVRYSIISGNGAGVTAQGGQVDARENWWGAENGPSGGVEDPATGRLADGDGDSVSQGVRFDPYYVTDPRTGSGELVGDDPTETPTSDPTEEPPTEEPTAEQPTEEPTVDQPTDEPADDGDAGSDDPAGDGDDSAGGADGGDDDDDTGEDTDTDDSAGDDTTTEAAEEPSETTVERTDEPTTAVDGQQSTTTTSESGTDAPAGPSAPVNGTETTDTDGGNQTARVIGGGETTTSSGFGPGFGVFAALVAFGASALLLRRD
nr:right-handed parallel beta-helix repeat-containing protein [Halomarina oriensis]